MAPRASSARQKCPICCQEIDSDLPAFEFHVNECLSSTANPRASTSKITVRRRQSDSPDLILVGRSAGNKPRAESPDLIMVGRTSSKRPRSESPELIIVGEPLGPHHDVSDMASSPYWNDKVFDTESESCTMRASTSRRRGGGEPSSSSGLRRIDPGPNGGGCPICGKAWEPAEDRNLHASQCADDMMKLENDDMADGDEEDEEDMDNAVQVVGLGLKGDEKQTRGDAGARALSIELSNLYADIEVSC